MPCSTKSNDRENLEWASIWTAMEYQGLHRYVEGNEDFVRFILSGISAMCAGTVTNPIEVVKVRMQLENQLASKHSSKNIFKDRYYPGIMKGIARLFREEGLRGLYRGITPALLREASYTTIRLGMYEPTKVFLGETDPAHTPLWKKVLAGAISGTIGATIANPTDLVKIRFMGAGFNLPYKNTWHAFKSIVVQEGVLGLWTGVGPTVKRAALVTATQISSYDHTKHLILNAGLMEEGPILHIASSVVAGFVTNIVTSPVDIVRTRIMTQKREKGSSLMYKGTVDCILKTVKAEGILGLYKGFIPNWTRTGMHTITIFFVFEQLRRFVGMKPM